MWSFQSFQYLVFAVYSGPLSIDLVRISLYFFFLLTWDLSVFVLFFFFSFSTQGLNPHYMSDSLPAEPPRKPKMSFLNSLILITKYLWLSCIQPLIWLEGEKFNYLAKVKRIYLDVLAFIALSHGCTHTQHICRASAIILPPDFFISYQKGESFFQCKAAVKGIFPTRKEFNQLFY